MNRKPFAVCSVMASGWLCPIGQFNTYDEADDALEAFWARYPNAWLEIGQWDRDLQDYVLDSEDDLPVFVVQSVH